MSGDVNPRRSKRRMWWTLAIVTAVFAALFAWTRTLVARAERNLPPIGKFVEVDGLRLHYVERGTGQPVVLLHGVYGGLADFTETIFAGAATRCRAIAFDRPGHGYSDRPTNIVGTPAEQARILHAAITQLSIERPILVGFSWSGSLVMSYALQFPRDVAGVLTINSVLYDWEGDTSVVDTLTGIPLLGPLLAHTITMPLGMAMQDTSIAHAFAPAAVTESFVHSPVPLAIRPSNLLANASDMRVIKGTLRAQSPRYKDLAVPLAIVVGLGDRIAGPQFHSYRVHGEVPGSLIFPIEGGGHQVLYSHPKEVLAGLDALLDLVTRREAETRR